jgi:methyltransferase-like protein
MKDSNLRDKYRCLLRIFNEMMSIKKEFRPDCDEILSTNDSWSLNLKDIYKDVIAIAIKMNQTELNSFRQKFYVSFIEKKMKFHDESRTRSQRFRSFLHKCFPM